MALSTPPAHPSAVRSPTAYADRDAALTREQLLAELAALRQGNAALERAEASLRASEAYALSLFQTAREPLLLLDEDLRVRAANRAFYVQFRAEPGATENHFLYALDDGQWDIPRLRRPLEAVIPANATVCDLAVELDFRLAGRKAMLLNARCVSDAGGRRLILLAFEDVTDRTLAQQELEQRVRQRTAELEAANRELEAFSYSVSHDLRSPLRALDGYTRILLEDHAPELAGAVQEYVRDIRRNARKMGQLVDDLLAFSRLGRQGLQTRPVAPAALVRQALEDLRAEHEGRQVDVVVGDLPTCRADPALLRQAWVNLIGNALKYTNKRSDARVEIGSRREAGEVVYFVRDNGVGFDMRYAGKLFGVFQRLHKAGEFEGTGVGLAVVQRIVHRHGGRVWAEAALGQGATFFFTLPPVEVP
jgi:signal transduction histidine kinase